MKNSLPLNAPRNSYELMNQGGFDDKLYITACVHITEDKVTVNVNEDCPLITTVKGWDEASGGLKGVMSRADAIKNLNNDIHQMTGNAVVYIRMPDHTVKIWTTERDGPPVWAGYSTGTGGVVGAEGPAMTSVKEMSEEVGIVIRDKYGDLSLLSYTGILGSIDIIKKGEQIPTVKNKTSNQGIKDPLSVLATPVQELQSPVHSSVTVKCGENRLFQHFYAHVLWEADHFDKPENIGNTVSFQRYFFIDLSDMGLNNDDILFVNPDPFDSPAVPATFEELESKHVTSDGRIVKAFPPIASILHPNNRGWAHPDQMLKQTFT